MAEFFSRQSLDGLLVDAIAMLPASQHPSLAIKLLLIARQLQVERMNHTMNAELLVLTSELNNSSIPYIVLKGLGVSTLYPNSKHRVCGDIVSYVRVRHCGGHWPK